MRRISDTIARMAAYRPPGSPAGAVTGQLTRLTDFGINPGALDAQIHLPPGLAPGAPLVVVLHGCTQTAAGYDQGAGWSTLADEAGFAVLFPEQRRANNANLCFNWFEPADIARSGGEAESIAQMVEAMVAAHGLDRDRIFVTGLSAGGAMTAAMLATYPDLFSAGAIIGGLPYHCATGVSQALDRMRGAGGANDSDAATAVRNASGREPRVYPAVAIWHGSADATVVPSNAERLAGQWRGVHGLPLAPSETAQGGNWEHRVWRDATGRAAVEQWTVAGMGHGVPIDPAGPAGLGQAGPYMLDVGLSSTHDIAAAWGLVDAEQRAATPPKAVPRARTAPSPASGVHDVIETALRSAGLLR